MVTQLSLVTPVANPHRALLWLTASRTFSSPVQMDRAEAVEGSEDKAAATYAARHQSLFRSVNEQIEDKNQEFDVVPEYAAFVCECADDSCMERISLTLSEYEDLRRCATHFVVLPGHLSLEFERIVERREGYMVVEKFGEAGKQALRLDPRRALLRLA